MGTGYLSGQIEAYLQQRSDAEYLISREDEPLGTGGAISHALPLFKSEKVLVLNGDSYIAFSVQSLLDFHQTRQADATLLLSSATQGNDYGHVVIGEDQKILAFEEKPENSSTQLINAGVYCLNIELIKDQPKGNTSLERDWLPQWANHQNIRGMALKKPFNDIGTIERYELAQQLINYN